MTVRPEDLAATLLRRHQQRKKHHRERGASIQRILEETIRAALEAGRIRRAWLIGSLAYGHFGERSDVDVVVEGLAPTEVVVLWNEIGEQLGVQMDLMRLEELSSGFHRRVLREGVPLHVS